MDRNGNGTIDDGSELFGDSTIKSDGSPATGGFDALADLDSNSDGIIDANDEAFEQLRVLTDANGDGVFEKNEYITLEEAGIASIDLGDLTNGGEIEGGQTGNAGTITWTDGGTGLIQEVIPERMPMYSIPNEVLDVPNDISALPDIPGGGTLYSLHQAMARDETGAIRAALEAYLAAERGTNNVALLNELLYTWAGVEGVAPNSRGGSMDARQLEFLEKLMGEGFVGQNGSDPNPSAAPMLTDMYNSIAEEVEATLSMQTVLASFFENADFDFDEETEELTVNLDSSFENLNDLYQSDRYAALVQIEALRKVFKIMGVLDAGENEAIFIGVLSQQYQIMAMLFNSSANLIFDNESAVLNGTNTDDILVISGSGGATLNADFGNDTLIGGAGNDTIYAGLGNDTLVGGEGDDYLKGGEDGNDVYIWNLGDGNDTIYNYKYNSTCTGVLKFGEGISPDDVELSSFNNDAIFVVKSTGERITVQYWFSAAYFQLTAVEFDDGTVWTQEQINAMPAVFHGTSGNDVIYGYSSNDYIEAGDGDDTISSVEGNDVIYGGAGNDTIDAGLGNDTLVGGEGDDYLKGGEDGNDVYIWNLGDGNDTINNSKYNSTCTGILKFGEGISADDIEMFRSGYNAVFVISVTGESITVQDWFSYAHFRLAQVEFADGTIWSNEDIDDIISAASSQSAPMSMQARGLSYSETKTALALLSAPSPLSGFGMEPFGGSGSGDSGWDMDPSLAALMNEPEISSEGDYNLAQRDVNLALAALGFGSRSLEQAGDISGSASGSNQGQLPVAASAWNSLGDYFKRIKRHAA
jgi:hypothetical protein